MDHDQFDSLTRSFGAAASRRGLMHVLTGGGLAALLGWPRGDADVEAKKKGGKKHKKKKNKKTQPPPQPQPPLNQFGCLDVGQPCQGDSTLCCSGICDGSAPQKGKPDTSVCVAHNIGGCTLDRSLCVNALASPCSATSVNAFCQTTTGQAAFCGESVGTCQPCGKDKDCEALGFGAGSACVILRTEGFCVMGCEGINRQYWHRLHPSGGAVIPRPTSPPGTFMPQPAYDLTFTTLVTA